MTNITTVITNELQRKITKEQSDKILQNLRSELSSLNDDRDSTISEIVELNNQKQWISKYTKNVDVKLKDKSEFEDRRVTRITGY